MKSKRKKPFIIITAVVLIIAAAAFIIFRRPNERLINPEGDTVITRFNVPEGFERMLAPQGSFGRFLQELPLLPDGSLVHYYDGSIKLNSYHEAVLEHTLPGIDLEQCADVVMHLYAEYLYSQERYEEIGFHFVNGFYCDFASWAKGMRPNVNGEEVTWLQSAQPDSSRESFNNYLRIVYAYSSTLSLEKEMAPVSEEELAVGDVFIRGGSPGHVVIVVDMAINPYVQLRKATERILWNMIREDQIRRPHQTTGYERRGAAYLMLNTWDRWLFLLNFYIRTN